MSILCPIFCFSHHSDIEVIGIELAEISSTKLHRNSDGFVEIRVSFLNESKAVIAIINLGMCPSKT
jgi:hypothetical protein